MDGMGSVERVLMLGIVAVIVAIVGVAVWGATSTEGSWLPDATDGGVSEIRTPGATVLDVPDVLTQLAEARKQRQASRERALRERLRDGVASKAVQDPVALPGATRVPAHVSGTAAGRVAVPETFSAHEPGSSLAQGKPGPAAPAPSAPSLRSNGKPAFTHYTVVEGDSLWKIARRAFGDGDTRRMVDRILEANPAVDPDRLRIGMTIKLPGKMPEGLRTQPVAAMASSEQAVRHPRLYEVLDGDSLQKIAKRELGDSRLWTSIYEVNRDRISDPGRIFPGMTLRLPNPR